MVAFGALVTNLPSFYYGIVKASALNKATVRGIPSHTLAYPRVRGCLSSLTPLQLGSMPAPFSGQLQPRPAIHIPHPTSHIPHPTSHIPAQSCKTISCMTTIERHPPTTHPPHTRHLHRSYSTSSLSSSEPPPALTLPCVFWGWLYTSCRGTGLGLPRGHRRADRPGGYGNFDIILGPSLTYFLVLYQPTRAL